MRKRRISLIALIAVFALIVAACSSSSDETTTTTTTTAPQTTTTTMPADPTIAEIVAEQASGDPAEFTILLAALKQADLVDALNNPDDELTVFAPTDEAFGAALEALGLTPEELLASEDLPGILLYHVAPGVFDAGQIR